ncbi:unnamed protein product [Ilex paraguariensis]|uniref:B-like cyclin n=1 Tax=Ilex paraguariensis TaxID=185542 RepID=A0ABC8TJS6_9AQUA
MATHNRRSSTSSSSSFAKRHSVSENPGKATAVKPQLAKKRPALTNLTNQRDGPQNASRTTIVSKTMVPCNAKVDGMKKGSSTFIYDENNSNNFLPKSWNVNSSAVSSKDTYIQRVDQSIISVSASTPLSCMDVSPSQSDNGSVSLDESMSTSDSLGSPEFEYVDKDGDLVIGMCDSLNTSDHAGVAGDICKANTVLEIETVYKVVNVDDNVTDPQFCATIACDIYKNLRTSETKKRPAADFMEEIQKDINPSMRAILIDWLVEVAEEYRLVPETLFLAVNYIDRYLSGNTINRQRLQLLGVACMMIAAKYEEICAPQVEEFCYITDNTYLKNEVLQMESAVLNYLKFEMTAPTAKCFLRRFVRAAQGLDEVPSIQLECLASYLSELSLLEYKMLRFAPSLIAASATFLAKFILVPSEKPWASDFVAVLDHNPPVNILIQTSTLKHYTLYKPSDLCDCVKELHRLSYNDHNSTLPAIREKYSQHKNWQWYRWNLCGTL